MIRMEEQKMWKRTKCLWCKKVRTEQERVDSEYFCAACKIKHDTCSVCKQVAHIVSCDAFSDFQMCRPCMEKRDERERKAREQRKG